MFTVLKHQASDRQAVLVVKRQIAIDRITPPPVTQAVGRWSVAAEAEINGRFIGTF